MSSSWLPFSHPSQFFSLSFLLPSLHLLFVLFYVFAHTLFCLSLASLIFSTFSAFAPFLIILGFLVSYVLTIFLLIHQDQTSSFSAHHPLLPPKVLTSQHTPLCVAVHTLDIWRGLVTKTSLYPWQCLSWCVGGFGSGVGN